MNFSPNLSPMVASNLAPATRDAVASLYCVFRAGEDFFALPLLQVEEIISAPIIAELPASPPFLLGMLVTDDESLPVLDLALSPVLPDPQYGIVVRIGAGRSSMKVAIAADDLISPGTATVPENSMQFLPTPGMARLIHGRLNCSGVTAWALDPDYLINALLSPTRD